MHLAATVYTGLQTRVIQVRKVFKGVKAFRVQPDMMVQEDFRELKGYKAQQAHLELKAFRVLSVIRARKDSKVFKEP